MADNDDSDIRNKVAQYFVNKAILELQSKDPQIKIDDLTYLQALPQFQDKVDEDEQAQATQPKLRGIQKPAQDVEDAPPGLPPLFPEPVNDHVSWSSLLDFERKRRGRGPTRGPDKDQRIPDRLPFPPWYSVAIIGAGVAGLRTAKLLQDMGIPYKIFEASDRPGGRVYTYEFANSQSPGKHDYYDVGAMRFPNNEANKKTFELFKELGLESKLIKYVMGRDDNIRYYNGIKTTAAVASTAGDHFKDEIVPKEYLNKEYVDLRGKTVYGVNACTAAAYDPFRKALIDNFDKGWEELMKYDWASTRSYLAREKPNYPLSVIHWMETRNSGTGGFDRAFAEAILDSLEFNDPREDVQWRCLEGGSKRLIDAMVAQLTTEPSYGHQVTAVKLVYRPLFECFPNLPGPRRPFRFPLMKVSVAGKDEYFAHVISTSTFANLSIIDTERVPMTYKQRQAIRTLNYGPAVKVGIRFKTRWWEQAGLTQLGGSSYTDRPTRTIVYPSAGLGEAGPGVLMATYNWHQDANRFGALIEKSDWSKQLDPNRKRPWSEEILVNQLYSDLSTLHGVSVKQLRADTLDYHAFNWYHNPFTMGAYAHFAPGQFSTFFADIVQPAAYGRFHFAGEVASAHHAWVAGALDSAMRVVDEIIRWDFPIFLPRFRKDVGRSVVFSDEKSAEAEFVRGLFSRELEKAEV